jgi:SWIM zinc finger
VAYVQSPTVVEAVRPDGSTRILDFLRNHVFPLEDYFAAHHFRDIRCFDEYSNTPLEGTNGGLKYCENAVLPSMGMDKAAVTIIGQDQTKGDSTKRKASTAFHKTPVYTDTETSRHITQVAECTLQGQLGQAKNYASLRTDEMTWLVTRSALRAANDLGSLLPPMFDRMRRVTLDNKGVLDCDCGYTKRNGIPCRHIAHVAYKYSPDDYKGFTYQDTSMRWYTSFAKFVAVDDSSDLDEHSLNLRTKLTTIRETQGANHPKAPILASTLTPIYNFGSGSSARFKDYTLELSGRQGS